MSIAARNKIWDGILRFKDSPTMGLLYALLATICFSCSYVAAQLAMNTAIKISAFEVVLVRSILQVVLLVPFILMFRSPVLFGVEKWTLLFTISIVNYGILTFGYWALDFIPASILFPLSATCPLFAPVFSYFILKEKCLLVDAFCGIMGLLGVIIIARPKFIFGKYGERHILKNISPSKYEFNYLVGCTIAVLFGSGKALFFTLVRKWARDSTEEKSDQMAVVLYPSILSCILTPPLMLFSRQQLALPKDLYASHCLFAVGILTLMGSCCNALAMKTHTSTVIGVIRNLDVVWGFLLQYFILQIWPTMWSVAGSVIIVVDTIIVCFRKNITKDDEDETNNSAEE